MGESLKLTTSTTTTTATLIRMKIVNQANISH